MIKAFVILFLAIQTSLIFADTSIDLNLSCASADGKQTCSSQEIQTGVLKILNNWFEANNKSNQLSLIAKMTTVATILNNLLPNVNFVGFYIVVDQQLNGQKTGKKVLEIGPYQSHIVATPIIDFGKGQCGQCWQEKKTQIMYDVTKAINYIACDADTKSEIVVPVFANSLQDEVIAVLDIDSQVPFRFSLSDQIFLEDVVKYLYN